MYTTYLLGLIAFVFFTAVIVEFHRRFRKVQREREQQLRIVQDEAQQRIEMLQEDLNRARHPQVRIINEDSTPDRPSYEVGSNKQEQIIDPNARWKEIEL